MILCNQCGNSNEDGDEFCGSCGSFLEWTGERVAAPPAPPPPPPPPPVEPERPGIVQRVKAVVGLEGAEDGKRDAEAKAAAETQGKAEEARLQAEEAQRRAQVQTEAREAAERAAVEAAKAEAERVAKTEAERPPAQVGEPAAGRTRAASSFEGAAAPAPVADAAAEQAARVKAEADAASRRAAAMVAKPPPSPPARPVAPPPVGPGAGTPASTMSSPVAQPAAQRATPPAAQRPGPEQPAAVRPAAARPRPVPAAPAAPSRTIEPGDLVCGQCGEGNTPTRKFCRRCGTSLVAAVVAPPGPWWRRIFHRKKKTMAAGERRRQSRVAAKAPSIAGKVVKLILVVAVLAGVVAAVGPYRKELGTRLHNLRIRFLPQYIPARPTSETANSSLPGFPPSKAFDLDTATYWATAPGAYGVGAVLTVTFQGPVDLGKIIVTSGNAADFPGNSRPKQIHLTYPGGGVDLNLVDTPKPQTVSLNAPKATSAQLAINEVYKSETGHSCAIAEIEFFAKR